MTAPRVPVKDPEALRAKLLADPNTRGIAEKLGVELAEYVNQVVYFASNPTVEPQLYMVEDEDLRSLGMEPPDADAIGKYVMDSATIAQAAEVTDYSEKKEELVSMTNLEPVATGDADAKLKEELEKQLRGKRGGKS